MLAFGRTAMHFSCNLLPVSGGSHPAQACGREQQLHAVLYLGLIPSEAGVSSRASAKSNTVIMYTYMYIYTDSGAFWCASTEVNLESAGLNDSVAHLGSLESLLGFAL